MHIFSKKKLSSVSIDRSNLMFRAWINGNAVSPKAKIEFPKDLESDVRNKFEILRSPEKLDVRVDLKNIGEFQPKPGDQVEIEFILCQHRKGFHHESIEELRAFEAFAPMRTPKIKLIWK